MEVDVSRESPHAVNTKYSETNSENKVSLKSVVLLNSFVLIKEGTFVCSFYTIPEGIGTPILFIMSCTMKFPRKI